MTLLLQEAKLTILNGRTSFGEQEENKTVESDIKE